MVSPGPDVPAAVMFIVVVGTIIGGILYTLLGWLLDRGREGE